MIKNLLAPLSLTAGNTQQTNTD